jgi:tetratricopeptide (TPR) repeat protein
MVKPLSCIALATPDPQSHGASMPCSRNFLIAIVLTSAMQASTLSTSNEKLAAAFALDTDGHPAQAIAAAEVLLQSHTLTTLDQARALNLEGMCYQQLDQSQRAVHSLEAAQALLTPQDMKELGAVLDNLGLVYSGNGNFQVAAHLYQRAFRVYEAAGYHGGMVRVANNQAGVALSQRKIREATKYLELANREAQLASDLNNDDRAALLSTRGWLALTKGDVSGGVESYQRALRLWKEAHGEQHPLTAWGMLLLGQAQAFSGERQEGVRTMGEGLARTAATLGDKSLRYLAAQTAYARLLDQTRNGVQAGRLREDVRRKQPAAFASQGCNNCTISGMALR